MMPDSTGPAPSGSRLDHPDPQLRTDVAKPYNWDRYEDEFVPGLAYNNQLDILSEVFASFAPEPETILEIGPGLGRVTKLLTSMFPLARFALFDVSEAAIEKTSDLLFDIDFSYGVGQLQDVIQWGQMFPFKTAPSSSGQFDLVVAIEVLMHVPPDELDSAVKNLFNATRKGGYLVTCDWTAPLPGDPPIRVQNYRHDYAAIFGRYGAGADHLDIQLTGYQSVFLVQPRP